MRSSVDHLKLVWSNGEVMSPGPRAKKTEQLVLPEKRETKPKRHAGELHVWFPAEMRGRLEAAKVLLSLDDGSSYDDNTNLVRFLVNSALLQLEDRAEEIAGRAKARKEKVAALLASAGPTKLME